MARTVTDSDGDDVIEWTEAVSDADGDFLSVSLELDAIDSGSGFVQQDIDSSNVDWLSYEVDSNVPNADGSRDFVITISVDTTSLTAGNDYRFELTAEDKSNVDTRKVILSVSS